MTRTYVITGAASGIGAALAELLRGQGHLFARDAPGDVAERGAVAVDEVKVPVGVKVSRDHGSPGAKGITDVNGPRDAGT